MNPKKPINIFIVDDNNVFTMALKTDIENTFKNMSVKVYTFETGEKCMRRFIQMLPELVILDYFLNTKYPEAADGIKVLDWIKKENIDTKVIMLTSDDHIEIALKSLNHGASDYVVKTETQFRKINYSLLNLLKMIDANNDARKYKGLLIRLSLVIILLVGSFFALKILGPSFK